MTLFDKYGGRAFWVDAVDIFYARLLQVPTLARYFEHHDVNRVKSLNCFLLESTLGFTNEHFCVGVRKAHKHLKVPKKDFYLYVEMLGQVLREKGVSEEDLEEVVKVLTDFEEDIVKDD